MIVTLYNIFSRYLLSKTSVKILAGLAVASLFALQCIKLKSIKHTVDVKEAEIKKLKSELKSSQLNNVIDSLYCTTFKLPVNVGVYKLKEDNETITYDFTSVVK